MAGWVGVSFGEVLHTPPGTLPTAQTTGGSWSVLGCPRFPGFRRRVGGARPGSASRATSAAVCCRRLHPVSERAERAAGRRFPTCRAALPCRCAVRPCPRTWPSNRPIAPPPAPPVDAVQEWFPVAHLVRFRAGNDARLPRNNGSTRRHRSHLKRPLG